MQGVLSLVSMFSNSIYESFFDMVSIVVSFESSGPISLWQREQVFLLMGFWGKNNLSLCLNNCTTIEWEQFVNSILLFWEHIKWLWKGKWAPKKFLLTVLIDLSDMNPTSVFPMTKSHLLLYQGKKVLLKITILTVCGLKF